MRQMRCLIGGVTLSAPNFSVELVPGRVVDLDRGLPNGGTVAELVRAEWFEPVAPEAPRPRRRQPGPQDIMDAPAPPVTEEETHG
jgi:hypothetical protein